MKSNDKFCCIIDPTLSLSLSPQIQFVIVTEIQNQNIFRFPSSHILFFSVDKIELNKCSSIWQNYFNRSKHLKILAIVSVALNETREWNTRQKHEFLWCIMVLLLLTLIALKNLTTNTWSKITGDAYRIKRLHWCCRLVRWSCYFLRPWSSHCVVSGQDKSAVLRVEETSSIRTISKPSFCTQSAESPEFPFMSMWFSSFILGSLLKGSNCPALPHERSGSSSGTESSSSSEFSHQ